MADINGLVIVNNTTSDVTDVKLTIAQSSRQVHVSRVLTMSEFATAFTAKEYRGRPAQLSWRQNGTAHTSSSIVFSLPRELYADKALTAYLIIEPGYKVGAEAK